MNKFKDILPKEIAMDPFDGFRNWAMITAEVDGVHNSMIIGWGGLGVLWRKDVATVYVRENRYTYEFIEKADKFTISFYDEKYKEQLKVYGTKSGKDIDKDFVTNFHPMKINDAVTYEEAHTTIVCKKIYQAKLEPQFYLNDVADQFYGINNDLTRHHMYIGEIERIFKK